MGHRIGIAVLAASAALAASVSTSSAKEVRYPAAHPEIALKVPDEWSVRETPLGLELQSPQKDALVLAAVTAGDRKSVNGWSKRALERMGSAGVVFAKTGSAKSAAASQVAGQSDAVAPPKQSASPTGAPNPGNLTAGIAKMNGDAPYTFGGAPLVDPLKSTADAEKGPAASIDATDVPTISFEGANPGAIRPAGDFVYAGGTMRGHPVDVEFAVFQLGKNKRVLTEQQSGPTDARGVMIVRSLRDVTQ